MEKATIYDYARMCHTYRNTDCQKCPMWEERCSFSVMGDIELNKANEITLQWCEEHPVETRQSKMQKIIPNLVLNDNGCLNICPNVIDGQYGANCTRLTCKECKKKYWLAEVDENE